MKIEKYALLDTDFISKTHFIHGDTEKCLVDLVVEMVALFCLKGLFCSLSVISNVVLPQDVVNIGVGCS